MGQKVFSNSQGVAHKGSGGASIVFPDVCKTPSPGGPVPIPYPQMEQLGKASQEAKKVKADAMAQTKSSVYSKSSGDQPGATKGIVTQHNQTNMAFLHTSAKVKFEGKPVARMGAPSMQNHASAGPPAGGSKAESTADEIDKLLSQHKQKISQPAAYTYEQAKQVQAQFEQRLEMLLAQLLAAAQGNPGLQAAAVKLAAAARAAAKGE